MLAFWVKEMSREGTIVLKLIEVNEGPTFTVHKLRLLDREAKANTGRL